MPTAPPIAQYSAVRFSRPATLSPSSTLSSTNASTGMLDSMSPRTPPSCSAICSLIEGKGSSAVLGRRWMQVLLLDDLLGDPVLHPSGRAAA